jgi:hypothetical protein
MRVSVNDKNGDCHKNVQRYLHFWCGPVRRRSNSSGTFLSARNLDCDLEAC